MDSFYCVWCGQKFFPDFTGQVCCDAHCADEFQGYIRSSLACNKTREKLGLSDWQSDFPATPEEGESQ